MTTQGLALDTVPNPGPIDGPDDGSSGALGTLFDSSPARSGQTSVAAVTAFVLGLLALLGHARRALRRRAFR